MSDYPDYCLSPESSRQPIGGRLAEISEGGRARYQDLYDESLYDLTLVHFALTDAEKESIRRHWRDNRGEFSAHWLDGNRYSAYWLDEPIDSYVAPGRWRVESRLRGRMVYKFGYLLNNDGGLLLSDNGGAIALI